MSHFTVLVPARDEAHLAQLLAPFHEYECTGLNDQYVVDVDITAEVKTKIAEFEKGGYDGDPMTKQEATLAALKWFGLDTRVTDDEAKVDTSKDPFTWGYAIVQGGELIKAVNRTNPNRKWDWWTVGGRWRDLLTLKDGSRGAAARYDEVAWGEILALGLHRTMQTYHLVNKVMLEVTPGDDDILEAEAAWAEGEGDEPSYRARKTRETFGSVEKLARWDAAREVLIRDHDFYPLLTFDEIKRFFMSPLARLKLASNRSAMTYAIIDPKAETPESAWVQRGEMSWFGMSDEEGGTPNYDERYWAIVDALPNDMMVYVVDCHI